MKKGIAYFLSLLTPLILLFAACDRNENEAEELLQKLRGYYLEVYTITGHGEITADYGQRVYAYGVDFQWDNEGETTLCLTAPKNISGSIAHIAAGETAFEFDGVMLETGAISADGATPIDLIPVLFCYTREGLVTSCGIENIENTAYLHITCINFDNTESAEIQADLWFSTENYHIFCGELSVDGNRRLQCQFSEVAIETPSEKTDNF